MRQTKRIDRYGNQQMDEFPRIKESKPIDNILSRQDVEQEMLKFYSPFSP